MERKRKNMANESIKSTKCTFFEYLPNLIQNVNLSLFINHYHCLKKISQDNI